MKEFCADKKADNEKASDCVRPMIVKLKELKSRMLESVLLDQVKEGLSEYEYLIRVIYCKTMSKLKIKLKNIEKVDSVLANKAKAVHTNSRLYHKKVSLSPKYYREFNGNKSSEVNGNSNTNPTNSNSCYYHFNKRSNFNNNISYEKKKEFNAENND